MFYTHIKALIEGQKADRNPGHEIGEFLIKHSNSPEYLIGHLEAYLEAIKADQAEEKEMNGWLLKALKEEQK